MAEISLLPETKAFLQKKHGHIIGDRRVHPEDGRALPVFDPASGKPIASVPAGSAEEIDDAVRTARAALEGDWGKMRPADRERILFDIARSLQAHAEELAQIEVLNQGKNIAAARAIDVGFSVEFMQYMAGWATKIEGSTFDVSIPLVPGARYRAYSVREPVGVVAAIVPWNFPLLMAVLKVAPALAAGCTVVLKPSEETPLTALRFAEICLEAGLPPGVLNVVTGTGEQAGAPLSKHPGVDKVTFTGSTEVGKLVGAAAMANVNKVSLELGGKSPFMVFDDVDLQSVAKASAGAIFFNAGQVCAAGSRLYIQKRAFDRMVSEVCSVAQSMNMGPGLDPGSEITPLVSARQRERVGKYVDIGLQEGAKLAVGGAVPDREGFFFRPTVLVDTRPDMRVVQEEIFGPVLVASPFDDIDELVRLANSTQFGLAASVWTQNINTALEVTSRVQSGLMYVNTHGLIDPNMSYGGMKQSGMGLEMGKAGVEAYTRSKSICISF